jgi:hypothetical protein
MDFFEELKHHTSLNILSITSSPINFAELEVWRCRPLLPTVVVTELEPANARTRQRLFPKVREPPALSN